MKYKSILTLSSIFIVSSLIHSANADSSLAQKLSGKIVLQVEYNGEAWYINPANKLRYSLGRPQSAFEVMRTLGTGISNQNLEKFPLGLNTYDDLDNDNDGLSNRLETALGTNPNQTDSDNDSFSDKEELERDYNPNGTGLLNIDLTFAKKHSGKIFLQVESAGEAWYINPSDNKRYYLGRPIDAFLIMKSLGLGISNSDIKEISIKDSKPTNQNTNTDVPIIKKSNFTESEIMSKAPAAIRSSNPKYSLKYFTPEAQHVAKYTMDFLDQSGRLILANIISSAKKTSTTDSEIIYTAEVFFQDDKIKVTFVLKKQPDGSYLLANL